MAKGKATKKSPHLKGKNRKSKKNRSRNLQAKIAQLNASHDKLKGEVRESMEAYSQRVETRKAVFKQTTQLMDGLGIDNNKI